jgi:pimeloyl-ACP methyl ester carboxylesterase
MRAVHIEPPAELGVRDGLAYALFLPQDEPVGGVVILHGAGSCKESHFDFGRALRAAGIAAVAFDQRGHGASGGALDGRMVEDVATMAALLGPGPIALRGSSMGGYVALVAARAMGACAVVAICPASAQDLLRGLNGDRFDFHADNDAVAAFLAEHDAVAAAQRFGGELLLMHAEGDEQVPVERSRELHRAVPASRLVTTPGGHHRSIQHDPDLQAVAVRFLDRALRGARD